MSTNDRNRQPNSRSGTTGTTGEALQRAESAVSSQTLLRGQKTVAIEHNGELYRLQNTRTGKLILTK